MIKNFLKNNLYLVALWILCVAGFAFYLGHYSNILLDVGREVYYPERILNGKILYKDLFNIYGPLAYQWNAVLYKVFGTNLKTLYASGVVCALGIVSAVYLIAKHFLSRFLSFAVGIFTIATGICAVHLFNYTFPYSQAMLYGTFLSLLSLLALLRFNENGENKFLYLSALLSGCAAVCKYDFLLFAAVVLANIVLTKNIKTILKALCAFLSVPVISFGILFLHGLTLTDIIRNSQIINAMLHTKSLDYFYRHSGVYFSIPILIYWIVNFTKAGIGFCLITTGVNYFEKNRELGIILLLVGIAAAYYLTNPAIFAFLIGLTIILAVVRFKEIKNNKLLLTLTLSTLALSLKSLWGLTPLNYGNYYCAAVIITFLALVFTILDKRLQKAAGIYILVVSLWFVVFSARQLASLDYKITSKYGTIYTAAEFGQPVQDVISFLNTNKAPKTAAIFPEGLIINFLSENSRISDDFYNSLLPLYTETFSGNTLITHFDAKQPDYIVFSNLGMQDYNTGYICRDYALDFCAFVTKNYAPAATFGKDFGFVVFKRRSD